MITDTEFKKSSVDASEHQCLCHKEDRFARHVDLLTVWSECVVILILFYYTLVIRHVGCSTFDCKRKVMVKLANINLNF